MCEVKGRPERATAPGPRARHRLGAHLSIAGGVHNALAAALRLRCETVQVFVKNQRQWRMPPLDPTDVEKWHSLRSTPGFGPIIAHATYLINLASPQRRLRTRSERAFEQELQRCQMLGIRYLVAHPGSAVGSRRGPALKRVARSLDRVLGRNPELSTMPLLETTAGQGDTLGRSLEEVGEILAHSAQPDRLGVCIDTCHVFAAGYDIREAGEYERMIRLAERAVGRARIRCWHLNDSKGPCGSKVDRHEHIGRGQIGSAGFRNVLADPRFADVPMIIETPKGTDPAGRDWDRVNLRRLRSLSTRLR